MLPDCCGLALKAHYLKWKLLKLLHPPKQKFWNRSAAEILNSGKNLTKGSDFRSFQIKSSKMAMVKKMQVLLLGLINPENKEYFFSVKFIFQLEEAQKVVFEAISAGIFNDLGSGSNVDMCVIKKGSKQLIRPYNVANLKPPR